MSDDLQRELDQLKAAIAGVESGTADHEQLSEVLHAVERKLDDPTDETHHEHLLERLQDSLTAFEASHPTLSQAFARAIDTLSASGI